jgi:hypothetical protein
LNVFTPFCLYVSARILAQASKSQPHDDETISSLRFLLSALMALKDANPLVESYLIQLDLEGIGLSALQENAQLFSQLEKSVVCDQSYYFSVLGRILTLVSHRQEYPSKNPPKSQSGLLSSPHSFESSSKQTQAHPHHQSLSLLVKPVPQLVTLAMILRGRNQ